MILLLSGGLDSVVLLYELINQGISVRALLFSYGQRHRRELFWASYHCERVKITRKTFEIPTLPGSSLTDVDAPGVVVPNRNAIFLSLAANYAVQVGETTVAYGANKDDGKVFADCRPAFVAAFNELLDAAGVEVEIVAPFITKTKREIAERAKILGVSPEESWSCYAGGNEPCGECLACQQRAAALK